MKYIQLNIPATEKEKIEKMIKELTKEWYGKPLIDNVGHYLNKSAILYVDALLNAFLDRVYEVFAKHKGRSDELKGKSIKSKLNDFQNKNLLDKSKISNAKHVEFIAQLRHNITHCNGFVDVKFLEECGIKNNQIQGDPLWDTNIWPDINSFLNNYKENHQLSLAIEKVIIPYLRHAVEFIDEFVNQILTII